MKKVISVLLILCIALSFGACGRSGEINVVKIGVFEPLSGENSPGGKQEALGIEYANALCPTVEIGGKIYEVQLVTADNGSSSEKAAEAAELLADRGVSLVLGSYGSGESMAGGPVFEKAGIPCVGVTCTNQLVTEGNSYYFRICFLNSLQGEVLARYAAKNRGARRACCLVQPGDDYSTDLVNYFVSAFEYEGGECVIESFDKGDTDFSDCIESAVNNGCDILFAPVSVTYGERLLRQCGDYGLDIPILSGDNWDTGLILRAAGDSSLDVTISTFCSDVSDPEFEPYFKKWVNADVERMDMNGGDDTLAAATVMGYDAYFFALEALKNAGSPDAAKVMKALLNTGLTGIAGDIVIDDNNGDAVRDTVYFKRVDTENGSWIKLGSETAE